MARMLLFGNGTHCETAAAATTNPTYAVLNISEEVGEVQVRLRLGGRPVGTLVARL